MGEEGECGQVCVGENALVILQGRVCGDVCVSLSGGEG